MKEAVKRSVVVIILIALAVAAGFGADKLFSAIKSKNYPRAYSEYVEKYAKEYGVPKDVIYAVIKVESDFKYDAESYKSAKGLMQLMPGTFEWLCQREGLDPEEQSITDPETNIRLGTCYLSYLYGEFGIWETVYAAYNAGQGTVRTWLEDERYGKDGHLIEIPYSETASYVKKVADAREIYADLISRDEQAAAYESK